MTPADISQRTQNLLNIIKNPEFKEKFRSPLGDRYWNRLASDISYHEKVLHPLIDKAKEGEMDHYKNVIEDLKNQIRGYELAIQRYRSTTMKRDGEIAKMFDEGKRLIDISRKVKITPAGVTKALVRMGLR